MRPVSFYSLALTFLCMIGVGVMIGGSGGCSHDGSDAARANVAATTTQPAQAGADAGANAENPAKPHDPANPMVSVHLINSEGSLVGPVSVPKVIRSEEAWRERLSPLAYRVLREDGTERAGTGELLHNKAPGVYVCAGCDLPLFHSKDKFDSGTGWPSFTMPIAASNIVDHLDRSYGMLRTENVCARCDGHLGHVFNDGPPPTGLRYCMNSVSLRFVPADQLASLAELAADATPLATAVFAGGCFWCTEAVFEPLDGVMSVVSGYAGGAPEEANYQAVSRGVTNHAEVIQITYDPAVITYDTLLDIFFNVAHDPTQLNRQGPDHGRQYRSAVFYQSEAEKQRVAAYIEKLNASGQFSEPVVTTLEPLTRFHAAETAHQDFVARNPRHGYVVQQALPKVDKLFTRHGDLLKDGARQP